MEDTRRHKPTAGRTVEHLCNEQLRGCHLMMMRMVRTLMLTVVQGCLCKSQTTHSWRHKVLLPEARAVARNASSLSARLPPPPLFKTCIDDDALRCSSQNTFEKGPRLFISRFMHKGLPVFSR
eukprot:1139932-Pelagomonas_calceolata.AAC.4